MTIFAYHTQTMQRIPNNSRPMTRQYFSLPVLAIIVLTLLPWPGSPLAAKTYRWVDRDGQIHYSDHIPPQEVDRGYSIINEQGVKVDSVGRVKTEQEAEEERRLQQQREEQERLAREKILYDQILLDTYTRVSDLEETRDRYIASLEGQIKVSEHKLGNLNRELEKLSQNAANLERDGKTVPDDLSKDITSLQAQVERENSFIHTQRMQQQEVREKFAADIQRFKELKLGKQSSN